MTLRHPDVIAALAIAAFGVLAIAAALTTPDPGFGVVGPAALPIALGVLVIVCSAWLLRDARTRPSPAVLEPLDRRPLIASLVATAIYFALFWPLGFVLSGSLYLAAEARILGSRSVLRDVLAAVAFSVGLYLLFVRFLTVDLPQGPLPF